MITYAKSKSLNAQIRDAERRVLNHQQAIDIRAATLIQTIHQQMIAPATLLLAVGIGFILGELTKPSQKFLGTITDKPPTAKTTPLRTALNLMSSARTLYATILPLVWILKSFTQSGEVSQVHTRQCQPMAKSQRKSRND